MFNEEFLLPNLDILEEQIPTKRCKIVQCVDTIENDDCKECTISKLKIMELENELTRTKNKLTMMSEEFDRAIDYQTKNYEELIEDFQLEDLLHLL